MKLSSKRFILPVLLVLVFGGVVGCKNRLPVDKAYPANPPNYTTVINYESGDAVNPTLLNTSPGAVSKILWGEGGLDPANTVSLPHSAIIVPVPASMSDGTAHACHVIDVFTDLGNGKYPSCQLRVKPHGLGWYDISPFSGVKFMINIQSGDDSLKRRFSIGVAQTIPQDDPDIGLCDNGNNGCNNNFGATIDNTNGVWVTKSYLLTDLTRESFGNPVTPSNFTGIHLKQVVRLIFEMGRNNSAGPCNVDFWLDEVEFF